MHVRVCLTTAVLVLYVPATGRVGCACTCVSNNCSAGIVRTGYMEGRVCMYVCVQGDQLHLYLSSSSASLRARKVCVPACSEAHAPLAAVVGVCFDSLKPMV